MHSTIALYPKISSRYPTLKPWVARVTALDPKFGFKREFQKCVWDYTNAAKSGKGTAMYYFLPPGLYEVYTPTSWKHERRYFIECLENGTYHEVSKEYVTECLQQNAG